MARKSRKQPRSKPNQPRSPTSSPTTNGPSQSSYNGSGSQGSELLGRENTQQRPILREASTKEERCKFHLPEQTYEAEYSCPYEIYAEARCVFHLPKPTAAEVAALEPAERWHAAEVGSNFQTLFLQHVQREDTSGGREFIDCRGFEFPIGFSFGHPYRVSKNISFRYSSFREADFSAPLVRLQMGFINPVVPIEGSDFDPETAPPTFGGDVDFSACSFMDVSFFRFLAVSGAVSFRAARFQDDALFEQVTFSSSADFSDAVFSKAVDFGRAVFEKRTTFRGARFEGPQEYPVSFYRADFNEDVSFSGARFSTSPNFNRANFNGNADFQQVEFSGGAEFRDATFVGELSLAHVELAGKVKFTETHLLGETEFTDVALAKDAVLVFDRVDLGKISFLDTNLELITFRQVEWAKPAVRLGIGKREDCLWDELRPISEHADRDHYRIAENYQQLVLNYEKKRDYERAAAFYIGEMEMHRKSAGDSWSQGRLRPLRWVKEIFNVYNVYRLASNYGTSYWQSFGILVVLVLVFSLTFLYSGFQPSKEAAGETPRLIHYNLVSEPGDTPAIASKWLADYREAVLFTLSLVTFQKDRFYEPVGWQSRLVLNLAVVIIVSQAALVFLAIRRRFRR